VKRFAISLAVMLFFSGGLSTSADARVRREKDLTLDEVLALEHSQTRLQTYDRALQALDTAHRIGKISNREYGYEQRDLVAFIGAEARYQNDIMVDDEPFPPEDAKEVMYNIAKYAIIVPAYIIGIAARAIAGSGLSISP
jgi:hypothetical protein